MIGPLLDALWPDDWLPADPLVEIRTIRDGKVQQQYLERNLNWGSVQDWIDDGARDGWDVYFGVLPRLRRSGTNADVPTTTPFIWADVDAKKADGGSKQNALHAINSFPTPPQIIVDSGGGYHCYWLLDRPEPLARAQEVMRWIARELSGDFVQDGARILRVPATTNWKREPTVARYLRFDLTRGRIRLGDLEGQMPVGRDVEYFHERTRVEDLPEWLEELIRDGAPQGQRSEACFRAVVWLLRYGRTRPEIHELFMSYPQGIGAKVDDMGHYQGARWIDKTITAAEGAA